MATAGQNLMVNDAVSAAASEQVGNTVIVGSEAGSSLTSVVRGMGANGLYNPITTSADIIVSSILASSYTTSMKGGASDVLLTPIRKAFTWMRLDASLGSLESGMVVAGVNCLLPQGGSTTA